ncbi:MAG: hypothetical protein ACKOFX_10485 [Solirubrobacterales bacterium]
MTEDLETYELEELAEQPGIYFNPRTEVVIAVDDSASVDQEAFDPARLGDADWIRISEEVPIDEQARDEALVEFQAEFHAGGGGSLSATVRDQEEDIKDGSDAPAADPDPDGAEDDSLDEDSEAEGSEE